MKKEMGFWGPLMLFFTLDIIVISGLEDLWVKVGSFSILLILFSMIMTIRVWIMIKEVTMNKSEDIEESINNTMDL